jgi:hypothetical protein
MEGLGVTHRRHALLAIAVVSVSACGGQSPPRTGPPTGAVVAPAASPDAQSSAIIPPGYGTLRQDDISIVIETGGVRTSTIPLDESVIRALAPDSYHSLHAYLEEYRRQIAQRASMHGIREPRVWYVRFDGLTPDARFVATDLTVTSGGRDYRPVEVIPLTSGFGEGRLQPRDTQRGLLIFDGAVDPSQPLVVSIGTVRNVDWDLGAGGILRKLDTERASIRGRAASRP